jgi:hypothetical protein
MLLKGVLLSYLLFSTTLCLSVVGACLVGAGSRLDSWLGEPAVSVLAGAPLLVARLADPPIASEEIGRVGTLEEYSRDSIMAFLFRCSSAFAWRSALMLFFAKTYATPPAADILVSEPHLAILSTLFSLTDAQRSPSDPVQLSVDCKTWLDPGKSIPERSHLW